MKLLDLSDFISGSYSELRDPISRQFLWGWNVSKYWIGYFHWNILWQFLIESVLDSFTGYIKRNDKGET